MPLLQAIFVFTLYTFITRKDYRVYLIMFYKNYFWTTDFKLRNKFDVNIQATTNQEVSFKDLKTYIISTMLSFYKSVSNKNGTILWSTAHLFEFFVSLTLKWIEQYARSLQLLSFYLVFVKTTSPYLSLSVRVCFKFVKR